MKKEKFTKATMLEYEASLFGACFFSFGLGAMFAKFGKPYASILILVGAVLHGWGMYKIQKRKDK